MKGKTAIRKALRDKDAQARIVDRYPAFEGVDRENGGLWRKTKNGLNTGPGLNIRRYLGEKRLEKIRLFNQVNVESGHQALNIRSPREVTTYESR